MTEKGVSKYWTPQAEEFYKKLLATRLTFAQRELIMTVRDLVKYDGRTKQAKRAIAKSRLRIATASDDELKEMVELEKEMMSWENYKKIGQWTVSPDFVASRLEELKEIRAKIREKGIKRSELRCR